MTVILVLSVASAVMGMFQFGWNSGVVNNPQKIISNFINTTLFNRGTPLEELSFKVDLIWSLIVSSFPFSGMFGGLSAGWCAEYFGRTRAILMVNVFVLLGSFFMGTSYVFKTYEMLIIGRLLVGFACGLFTGLVPLYLSEISPVNLRGAIGVVNQLVVVTSILLSQILGLGEALGSADGWPYLLALGVIPSAIQIIIMPLCPESPRYLLIKKEDEEAAYKSLTRLRGTLVVEDELKSIKDEAVEASKEQKVSVLDVLLQLKYRKAILIGIILHLSQQLSGINNIFYYSSRLFEAVGVSEKNSQLATLGGGTVLVIVTLISIPLMDRAGRRDLHLIGLSGILACSIVFTLTFSFQEKVEWFSYISIASALVFISFFAIGPGSIPWLIMAEMFSQGSRSTAVSIGVAVNWTANFIVGLVFLPLLKSLNRLIFLPFAILTAIFLVYLYFNMVETKGRSVNEITQILYHGKTPLENETEGMNMRDTSGESDAVEIKDEQTPRGGYINYGSYKDS